MSFSNRLPPRYDELPAADDSGMRHAWDVFGRTDRLGTLNHLSPERRRAALASVTQGRTISLSLPLDQPDHAPYARERLVRHAYAAKGFSWSDRISAFDTQASSQWDGLLHVAHKDLGFYGGQRGTPDTLPHLGVDAWARTGIIGRGVLVDVAAHLGLVDPLQRRAVAAHDLEAMLAAQGSELQPGDILCLRFGWHGAYRNLPADHRAGYMDRPTCAGLSAVEETAAFLWNHQIAALVSDNPTVEVQPGDRHDGFLHHRLITMLGMPLGELFDLDELAEQCRTTGAWEFLFVSVPLHLPGGVGSPANAVAVL